MSHARKRPVFGAAAPRPGKSPVVTPGEGFNRIHACWRLQKLQLIDPYGWHNLTAAQLLYVREKLIEFEAKDWNQIFVAEKWRNHSIPVEQFDCPKARNWMTRHLPDQDELWTLRLSGAERIWGILREGVFHLLFWDPNHQICQSLK
jgi:hypothetical protein